MTLSIKYKVVIDTNIYISGTLFGGNCAKILTLAKKKKIEVIISPEIYEEIIRKIIFFPVYEKFLSGLKNLLDRCTIKISSQRRVNICRDPKDNMFLALSQAGKADFLITGDKDLLVLNKFYGTKIVTPKEFLALKFTD